jgi:hypothetical protein
VVFASVGFFIRKNGLLQNKKSLPDSTTYAIDLLLEKATPVTHFRPWVFKICVLILTTPYLVILTGVDSNTLVKCFVLGETKKTKRNGKRLKSLFT